MGLRPQFKILPEGARAGGLLPWIIAVMMYLSCLALFTAVSLQAGLAQWSANLDRAFTVQVLASTAAPDATAAAVKATLEKLDGVDSVRLLSQSENAALLETWLGKGNVTEDLPVPALLDVIAAPGKAIDTAALKTALADFPEVQVDSSGLWLEQLKSAALALTANAYFILAIVLGATIAVVVFGTRAQLAAHNPTVTIVHHMGADDAVIAREFQYSFLQLGLKGGTVGLAAALITLLIIGLSLGDQSEGLLSVLQGRTMGLAFLLPMPLVAGLLTLSTARLTVLNALKKIP